MTFMKYTKWDDVIEGSDVAELSANEIQTTCGGIRTAFCVAVRGTCRTRNRRTGRTVTYSCTVLRCREDVY